MNKYDRIGSWYLADKFEIEHRHLRYSIKKVMPELINSDLVLEPKDTIKRRSARIKQYLLTIEQWLQVLMVMRPTEKHRKLNKFIQNLWVEKTLRDLK